MFVPKPEPGLSTEQTNVRDATGSKCPRISSLSSRNGVGVSKATTVSMSSISVRSGDLRFGLKAVKVNRGLGCCGISLCLSHPGQQRVHAPKCLRDPPTIQEF